MPMRKHFLSRLYGGELDYELICNSPIFLSRLYGGELSVAPDAATTAFLSRLYGGEPIIMS